MLIAPGSHIPSLCLNQGLRTEDAAAGTANYPPTAVALVDPVAVVHLLLYLCEGLNWRESVSRNMTLVCPGLSFTLSFYGALRLEKILALLALMLLNQPAILEARNGTGF